MYADIFGTIPIAEALSAKGALLGTILSFMMAVTTSACLLSCLRKQIKPKLLGTFITICTAGIIIVGWLQCHSVLIGVEGKNSMNKPKVAFICVHNSCRSQIAEALEKHFASEKLPAGDMIYIHPLACMR